MPEKTRGIFERPPGSGTWWISYCDRAGARHREKVGRRQDALERYQERRRELREGTYLAPDARRRGVTFGELARAAMAHRRARIRPRSYDADASRLNELLPLIGGLKIAELTPGDINQALTQLRTGQHASGVAIEMSTANRYRSLISSIFAFAIENRQVRENPVAEVKRMKEGNPTVRYLSADEEERLRAEIRRQSPEHEVELDLALYTGMRRGEQWTLKWSGIDLDAGILRCDGKTGLRTIVVNSRARRALEILRSRRSANSVFVCPETVSENERDNRRWFERAVRAAGFAEKFRWHDLRHTFASRLVMAGVDIRTVQELLGHKSIMMTMRYAHLSPDHRAAAAERLVPIADRAQEARQKPRQSVNQFIEHLVEDAVPAIMANTEKE